MALPNFINQPINLTYTGLLHVDTPTNSNIPATGVVPVYDGQGNQSSLSIGQSNIGASITGTLTATDSTIINSLTAFSLSATRASFGNTYSTTLTANNALVTGTLSATTLSANNVYITGTLSAAGSIVGAAFAKAWATFSVAGVLESSYNVASIGTTGTNPLTTTLTFTTGIGSTTYTPVISLTYSAIGTAGTYTVPTKTSTQLGITYPTGGSVSKISVVVFG